MALFGSTYSIYGEQTPLLPIKKHRTPCRTSNHAPTGDDQWDEDFRLAELVAHDDLVIATVGDLGVEDGQARVMRLTELGTQLRLEPVRRLDHDTFAVPRDLSTRIMRDTG